MSGQWHGFPAAVIVHVLAWAIGGVTLWMVAHALTLSLSALHAIVIESTVYTMRGIAIFVPAGLVVQEWALVLAGAVYGLTPAQALALGVVLRLRDLAFGIPLLLWPAMELGHGGKARAIGTPD